MAKFEDLLRPKGGGGPCRACALIEGLEPASYRAEVDTAMASARYGAATLARALSQVAGESVGESSVRTHRVRGHRAGGAR